jgi:hypothetical protein
LIAGFAPPAGITEAIDLRDISFGAGTTATFTEAANNLSGTLTVTSGAQTASLTLWVFTRRPISSLRATAPAARWSQIRQ